MPLFLDRLARYARPVLLLVASVLALGALLTITGMVLIGWSVYAVGYAGLLAALPAAVAVYRRAMDTLGWVTFAVFYVGVVLGLPVVFALWSHYAQDPAIRDALMARSVVPIGLYAGLVTWIGAGLFGLATYRSQAWPRGGSVMLIIAALLAIPAEIGSFVPFAWAVAAFLLATTLVWVAPQADE